MDLGTELLVVSTLDLPTIKNTRLSMDIIDSLGYEWDGVRVVFNRCSPDSDLTPQMVAEKLPFPVAAWLPTDERAALRAANRGAPSFRGARGACPGHRPVDRAHRSRGSQRKRGPPARTFRPEEAA